MKYSMRAKDICARFIDSRPDYESNEALSHRIGLTRTVSVDSLNKRSDIPTGLLFQICKGFGYSIMIYNPNPPEGLQKCYIVDSKKKEIKPREKRNRFVFKRDSYTGEVYRSVRKYKKHGKKFIKI